MEANNLSVIRQTWLGAHLIMPTIQIRNWLFNIWRPRTTDLVYLYIWRYKKRAIVILPLNKKLQGGLGKLEY